jgi:hypothetical protein
MFDAYALRDSIWKSRVNSLIGSIFLGSVALWAALLIVEASWGTNPLATAFEKAVYTRTYLPDKY